MFYSKYSLTAVVLILLLVSVSITACQSEVGSAQEPKRSSATLETAEVDVTAWSMTRTGSSGKVSIDFLCERSPFVGDFQQCSVQLKYLEQPRFADAIAIDGGMKAHGHGLPTVPVLLATIKKGRYKIDGLKYSMLGDWIVGFKVSFDGLTEQVIFDFII